MKDSAFHTPSANAALKHAHARVFELAESPDECIEEFLPVFLAFVSPALRECAEREFRKNIHDDQFRLHFIIWAYQGTLKLYESGALD